MNSSFTSTCNQLWYLVFMFMWPFIIRMTEVPVQYQNTLREQKLRWEVLDNNNRFHCNAMVSERFIVHRVSILHYTVRTYKYGTSYSISIVSRLDPDCKLTRLEATTLAIQLIHPESCA